MSSSTEPRSDQPFLALGIPGGTDPPEMPSGDDNLHFVDEQGFTHVINSRTLRKRAITSCAMVCHTLIGGDIHYLVARVRDTIPYREFVRGSIKDPDILRYLSQMSKAEKRRILAESFQDLADDLILNHTSRAYRAVCAGQNDFEGLRTRHKDLLSDESIGICEPPWVFPKGRKQDKREPDYACALRELEEETLIPSKLITYYDQIEPMEEIYTGLDGKTYKTVYFLGYIDHNDYLRAKPTIRSRLAHSGKRTSLSEEISKIRWLPYADALGKLDRAKQLILRMINTYLIFQLERTVPGRRHST